MAKITPLFYTPCTNPKKVEPFNTVGDSMTQEQFAEESEINNIIRSHDRNGVIEHINREKEWDEDTLEKSSEELLQKYIKKIILNQWEADTEYKCLAIILSWHGE